MARPRLALYALLAANTLSFMAEAIAMVAIPWFVFDLTGSYAAMGIVGFATVMPRVVATFLGGQVVDRVGFRTASIASDLLSGLSVCGIPLLFTAGHLSFPILIALVIAGAFFDGPGATAKDAMVPDLAAAAGVTLDRVNAFFQGARRLSLFIGPVAAGFLVVGVGAGNVLWVNGVVFGLSALVTLAFISPVGAPSQEEHPASFWANTLVGFRFIRQHRLMLWLVSIVCLMNFLDAPLATVQLPALVREHYDSAGQLGILIGADGGGAVLGTIVFSALAPRLRRRRTFIACFGVAGMMYLVVAAAPPYPVAVAAMFVVGLAGGPLNPMLMSIRQERVPLSHRARVGGTLTAMAFVAIPLGQLVGGYGVEWLGPRPVIALVAVLYLTVVASFLVNPVLHEMDEQPESGMASNRISS